MTAVYTGTNGHEGTRHGSRMRSERGGRSQSARRERSHVRHARSRSRSRQAESEEVVKTESPKYRESAFQEEIDGMTILPPEPVVEDRYIDNERAIIEESEPQPEAEHRLWAIAFILAGIAYFGLSGYIFFVKLGADLDPLITSVVKSPAVSARSLFIRQASAEAGIPAPPALVGIAALAGASCAAISFWVALFYPRWLFALSVTMAGGAASGAVIPTFWLYSQSQTADSSQLLSAVPFGALAAIVVFLACKWYKRLAPTAAMLESVRILVRWHSRFYLVVFAWTVLQGVLLLWCVISIGAANHVFNPTTSTCEGSMCGTMIIMGLAAFYLLAQYWLAGVLGETFNTTLAASYFSVGYWRLLGTRARTALLCDSIEAQVWFFTNIVDRIPWVKYVVLIFLGWYLRMLVRGSRSCNRYVGVISAIHRYEHSLHTFRQRSNPFIMRGHSTDALDAHKQGLGRRMGPLHEALRQYEPEGGHAGVSKYHWTEGLGAFLECHQTKSLLVFTAFACGVAGACPVYMLSVIFVDPNLSGNGVSWLVISWGFYVAFSTAYNLLNVVETGVCAMQVWIYDPRDNKDIFVDEVGEIRLEGFQEYLLNRLDIDLRLQNEQGYYRDVYKGPS